MYIADACIFMWMDPAMRNLLRKRKVLIRRRDLQRRPIPFTTYRSRVEKNGDIETKMDKYQIQL